MTNNPAIVHWEDRISVKDRILEWLSSESKLFTLSVMDTQEIEDIFRWFLEKISDDTTIVNLTLSPDTEVLKYGILEDITIDIGKEKFPLFYEELNRIESIRNNLTVSQTIGHEANIKRDAQFQNIEQTVNINMSQDEISLHYIFESKINRLLIEFISDIKILIDLNNYLFVFRFVGKGFSSISNDFQLWFQNYFCYRIQKIHGIKICVLSHCKLASFDIADQQFCDRLLHLGYDDIVNATFKRIEHNDEFCNGVIDPDTNTIDYKTFVRKWRSRLKKEVKDTNG